jgi:signal transduction histidine kinase
MVRKLVEEHHHGRLEISSAQGIGTTVTIHLPKATAARK